MDSSKVFKFIGPDVLDYPPVQASSAIPEWYKDLGLHKRGSSNDAEDLFVINDRGSDGSDVSTKLCLPFLDAMISGYIYRLEEDITVDLQEDGKPVLSWNKPNTIDIRPAVDMAYPSDCHPIQFGFKMQLYYETPESYSVLITHPLNRFDLPFTVPSGIVDSDIWGLPVFIPFFLKKDFIGTIKAGTPIFQMIPIKRDNWTMRIDSSKEAIEEQMIKEEKRREHVTAHYRKTTWQKKGY